LFIQKSGRGVEETVLVNVSEISDIYISAVVLEIDLLLIIN